MLKKFKGTAFVLLCIGMLLLLGGAMVFGINVGAVDLRPDWISGLLSTMFQEKKFLMSYGNRIWMELSGECVFPKCL